MSNDQVILRFSDVTFEYVHDKPVLHEASFSVRTGSRVTLMGQNGAGKSSLFKMITGEIKPQEGNIFRTPPDASIAISRQVMPKEMLELTVRDYFATAFKETKYNLDKLIREVFEVVNVDLPLDRQIKVLSGGQQARLLLAHALIQQPDILLLDEPTNNLDQQGIEHLTGFLMMYEKTVLVISHDADFLNAFSDGVLYLDVFTHKIEQYSGNYYDVVEEIKNRIERENLQNARMQQQIKEKRTQAEVFAHKGGKLRAVAKRMREAAEEAEESVVDVRQEDKTIREFEIPCQDYGAFFDGKVMEFSSISAIKSHGVVSKEVEMIVRKNTHVLISGPNGIGKSTILEKIATSVSLRGSASDRSNLTSGKRLPRPSAALGARNDTDSGFIIAKDIKIGYYKQDFSNFDFEQKALDALKEVMEKVDEHVLRSTAAGFLLDGRLLDQPIAALSEGQKGLLSFCRLVLMKPGLLILDEPTNHINFRHLPIIAKALNNYEGASLMVSHIPDFVSQIRIDETIDLDAL
jgi:ATPase subunit of ABC transporter with duplicated ATPase domains